MRVYAALSNLASPGGHAAHITGFLEGQSAFNKVLIVNESGKIKSRIRKMVLAILAIWYLTQRDVQIYFRASPVFMLAIFIVGKLRLIRASQIFWEVNGVIDLEAKLGGHKKNILKVQQLLECDVYARITKMIYVSEGIRGFYETKYPFLIGVGKVFENGYPKVLDKVRMSREDKVDVIGYVGLYTKWQDFESCCSILESLPDGVEKNLRMIGVGPEEENWRLIAKHYSCHIDWLPAYPYSQIGKAYEQITVGFVPDVRYSFDVKNSSPIKLVEYAASGVLPLLVSNGQLYHPVTFEELDIRDVLQMPRSKRDAINRAIFEGRSWSAVVRNIESYCFD